MSMAPSARRPAQHITIRMSWYYSGRTGCVCAKLLSNTSCLILPRIGEGRRDEVEVRCAGGRPGIVASKMETPNNSMQRTSLRAAADARRSEARVGARRPSGHPGGVTDGFAAAPEAPRGGRTRILSASVLKTRLSLLQQDPRRQADFFSAKRSSGLPVLRTTSAVMTHAAMLGR